MPDMKQLQLPSQRQLVERLLHLIEFNHPFALLAGSAGSGRSMLLELLNERIPEQLRTVSLIANGAMKMEQVREYLLRQMVPQPLFNAADSLADSFLRMAEGKRLQLAILIDNLDALPRELLGELWELMLANDRLPQPHKLSVVVTCQESWCQQQMGALKGRAMPPLMVEIAPLSPPEQKIFLYEKGNQLKVPSLLLTKEKVVEILAKAKGHPATIMMSLEDLMTDRRPRKRPEAFPIRKAAIILAAVALGLLGLTYLVPSFMGDNKPAEAQVEHPGGTLPPPITDSTLATDSSAVSGAASGSAASQPANSNGVAQDWKSDQSTLPNQVSDQTVTTQSQNYEGRRVVIADEVVEKLMTKPPVSGALPTDVEKAVVPGKEVVTIPEPAAAVPKPATTAPAPRASVVAAPAASGALKLTPKATLNAKSSSHFTVQLMGASNLAAVESFVSTHNLAGKVWVYQTQFRGNPWYVVIDGDHGSLAKARSAIQALPPALLKEQPWPKSFAQVKKELKK